MMMSRLPFDVTINGGSRFDLCSICSSHSPSSRVFKLGFQKRRKDSPMNVIVCRSNGSAFRVSVSPNVSPGKSELKNEVKMVDPLVAKQLAKKKCKNSKLRRN
ncbi:hypothetical protein Syun_024993 [Stephania yunnanensis]|uniref:Uncharacterized protein n=1 Tax=Stephania yunnanensis TaxID=152371 RepID=A0AAP0HQU4_9MAGN